ncbi:PP-loop family-domain-containing protein [Kockiozyma suomiensis]|uniref:PP-loop family-domain-containing protein n=1 Tax=Kockiozyma suomiensis TaxID=1337062 RepID=UPI003342F79F
MLASNKTMRPLLAAASTARPISFNEFTRSMLRLFNLQVPDVFGLAVSGGVDSMALAYLAQEFAQRNNSRVIAFTVDHRLRPESSVEAQRVASTLREHVGITEHRILQVKWNALEAEYDALGAHKQIVERAARVARYKLLVEQMVSENVKHLLAAHTWDDQIETAVMNLVRRRTGTGLSGMKDIAPIPGCAQILGGSGLVLVRPLLNWSKVRTIATCRDAHLPWFEDMTNHDPTYTTRNAIRTLLSQPQLLPEALQPSYLTQTITRQSLHRANLDAAAEALFTSEVAAGRIRFSPQSLSLEWTFRSIPSADYPRYPLAFRGKREGVVQRFLFMLVESVSPHASIDVPRWRVSEFAKTLFAGDQKKAAFMSALCETKILSTSRSNSLLNDTPSKLDKSSNRNKEIRAALGFVSNQSQPPPLAPSTPDSNVPFNLEANQRQGKVPNRREESRISWTLTRQPTVKAILPLRYIKVPVNGQWSEWVLWDGRVWIRVRSSAKNTILYVNAQQPELTNTSKSIKEDTTTLVVKAFTDSDYGQLQKYGKSKVYNFDRLRRQMNVSLTALYSLPVLLDPEISRMIMIPSLGFWLEEVAGPRFEVQYSMKSALANQAVKLSSRRGGNDQL